jgi:hypothetical protein
MRFMVTASTKRTSMSRVPRKETLKSKGSCLRSLLMADQSVRMAWIVE